MTASTALSVVDKKLVAIIEAAAHTFATIGYHRTQIIDIAAASGVALGTIYRHVDSKEQLFGLALIHGVGDDIEPWMRQRRWTRDIAGFLESSIAEWFNGASELADSGPDYDLEAVLGTLYDSIEHQRYAIRMLDRSAREWPELSRIYVQRVRDPAMALIIDILNSLQVQGTVRPLLDAEASARFVLETVAWFAMHRIFSPGETSISDETARVVALDHLLASLRT